MDSKPLDQDGEDHGDDDLVENEVSDIVRQVLNSMQCDISAADMHLYEQITEISDYIRAARTELASLRPEDISQEHIPAATDELDAVVMATENATNDIMEAAEAIENVAESVAKKKGEILNDAVTKIYEACSFQDITGQRISKVVNTLKEIETRIDAMMAAFGAAGGRPAGEADSAQDEAQKAAEDEANLLNGPAMPDVAQSQADIDALFDQLD